MTLTAEFRTFAPTPNGPTMMTFLKLAGVVALAVVSLALIGVALVALTAKPYPQVSTPAPAPGPALDVEEAPGAYCATSRLGRQIIYDGKTYECGGEKPYRWIEVKHR